MRVINEDLQFDSEFVKFIGQTMDLLQEGNHVFTWFIWRLIF